MELILNENEKEKLTMKNIWKLLGAAAVAPQGEAAAESAAESEAESAPAEEASTEEPTEEEPADGQA